MSYDNCITSKTIKLGRREYTIKLWHDQDCGSPLDNEDSVFITYNKSSRSIYGNTPLDEGEHEQIGRRIQLFSDPEGAKAAALAGALSEMDEEEDIGDPLISLPVYVYEHSSVMIRTSPFTCPWDSGQSGFIYVTPKTALEWQGGKRLTTRKVERVLKSLESVVEEYSKWCNGECYYYTVEDENGDVIEDIACGGFIGYEYAIESATEEVKAHHKWRVKQACAKRIAVTKERIKRLAWAARGVVTA